MSEAEGGIAGVYEGEKEELLELKRDLHYTITIRDRQVFGKWKTIDSMVILYFEYASSGAGKVIDMVEFIVSEHQGTVELKRKDCEEKLMESDGSYILPEFWPFSDSWVRKG